MRQDLQRRCIRRLDALHTSERLSGLRLPGFDLHTLRGKPRRYSLRVNGPWRISFEWQEGDAWRVDLEQYH